MFVNGVTLTIPGIFTDTVRAAVNEPLWTLPYELWCYALLFLMFAVSGRRSGLCVIAGALLIGIAWTATSAAGEPSVDRSTVRIFSGSAPISCPVPMLALFWPRIEKHALAVGLAGLDRRFRRSQSRAGRHDPCLARACRAVIGLGSSKAMAWFSKGGDASYGMYVFAWPVQQFAHLLIGSFWLSLAVAFLVTTAIGYGTWHGFEKRAMAYRGKLAGWLRGRRLKRAEI